MSDSEKLECARKNKGEAKLQASPLNLLGSLELNRGPSSSISLIESKEEDMGSCKASNKNSIAGKGKFDLRALLGTIESRQMGKVASLKKAQNWQFTLNEIEHWPDLKNYISRQKTLNYAIATKEKAPSTGHEHIHLYAQFRTAWKPSIKSLAGAHIEKCRGSPQQNIDYILKKDQPEKRGEIIWEEGEPRLTGQATTIEMAKKMSNEELDELDIHLYNIAEKIKDRRQGCYTSIKEEAKVVKVYYIYGPSGKGKSTYARLAIDKLGKDFDKVTHKDGFWHGVSSEREVAFYDDYRDSDMRPQEFIKFIDYSRNQLNIKGGSIVNNYKFIFITSIQDPRLLYSGAKDKDEMSYQWIRRMEIVDIEKYNQELILEKYLALIEKNNDEPDFDINDIL